MQQDRPDSYPAAPGPGFEKIESDLLHPQFSIPKTLSKANATMHRNLHHKRRMPPYSVECYRESGSREEALRGFPIRTRIDREQTQNSCSGKIRNLPVSN